MRALAGCVAALRDRQTFVKVKEPTGQGVRGLESPSPRPYGESPKEPHLASSAGLGNKLGAGLHNHLV